MNKDTTAAAVHWTGRMEPDSDDHFDFDLTLPELLGKFTLPDRHYVDYEPHLNVLFSGEGYASRNRNFMMELFPSADKQPAC